jgi:hypothetical protein
MYKHGKINFLHLYFITRATALKIVELKKNRLINTKINSYLSQLIDIETTYNELQNMILD